MLPRRSALAWLAGATLPWPAWSQGDDTLAAAVNGPHRTPAYRLRDAARHPLETLRFLGLKPSDTVIELAPGGGWYTEILAHYLREQGQLYAAHYASDDADAWAGRKCGTATAKRSQWRHPNCRRRRCVLQRVPGSRGA